MGTGVLKLLGGESGTGVYGVAQTRTRLLGRRTLNPQAAKQVLSECAIPTSRQNLGLRVKRGTWNGMERGMEHGMERGTDVKCRNESNKHVN